MAIVDHTPLKYRKPLDTHFKTDTVDSITILELHQHLSSVSREKVSTRAQVCSAWIFYPFLLVRGKLFRPVRR